MNNITISNLDDDIKFRLKKRAEKHGCSLEEEASTAVKSKVKSQKSKEIQRKHFVDLKWVVYFCRAVLEKLFVWL